MTREEEDDPMPCPDGWDCNPNWHWENVYPYGMRQVRWQMTKWQFNFSIMLSFQATYMRINNLWPGHVDDVWPYFYYMYNTLYGQLLVDSFIESGIPQPLADALRQNYTDDSQRKYGLLNMPNILANSVFAYATWRNDLQWIVNPADFNDSLMSSVFMKTIAETTAMNRVGHPLWTVEERKKAYDILLSPVPRDDPVMKPYWDFYLKMGWIMPGDPNKPPSSTNPPVPVQDPSYSAGKPNPQVWPGYLGNLPYAPKPKLQHQHLGGSDKDPDAKQVCVPHKGPLEKLIPTAGAVIGAGVGLVFMPGKWSKVSAAVTLGGFGFYYLANAYGWDAFLAVYYDKDTSSKTAATFLSVGGPVTGVTLLYDLELIPVNLDPGEIWMIIAAGAFGYVTLEPALGKILPATNSVSAVLTAPLAFLERVIGAFTDGCVEAKLSGDCLCQDANMKSKLAATIAGDIYGTTKDQLVARTACLRNQMLLGDWGTDPEQIGFCDPSSNDQSNPMACRDAEEWTDFNVDSSDKLMSGMYLLIKPCLDPNTPNFMPPRPEDAVCSGYGQHYRLINGKCIDYGIDNPNPALASHSNESCVIL